MPPLILHNVPDEECYVGDDGVKRPYAMIFNQHDAHAGTVRARRNVAETGSFGKSTRRSRSRTGTPRAGVRENPTLAAADKLFGDWVSNQASNTPPVSSQQQQRSNQQGISPPAAGTTEEEQGTASAHRVGKSNPVEIILRGYRSSSQQYAALVHYEDLAGPILEDYPRDPPATQRRWRSDLRDSAMRRQRHLTSEELVMVNRADGGDHWIKVTFESAEAAERALYYSPQRVLGHLVHAESYHGTPPAKDEPCPDVENIVDSDAHGRSKSMPPVTSGAQNTPAKGMPSSLRSRLLDLSPSNSHSSSQTLDTGTLSTSNSSNTITADRSQLTARGRHTSIDGALAQSHDTLQSQQPNPPPMELDADGMFCRRIPTARKARLLPAEQALLPQQSVMQRLVNAIPLVKWFGGSMIGNEVPRTELGEFDWNRASLYWKVIWWLDATFGMFRGDVSAVEKDE